MNNNFAGAIIATALLPTRGHMALIEFAVNYLVETSLENYDTFAKKTPTLDVIVMTRSFEPILSKERHNAFVEEIDKLKNPLIRIKFKIIEDDNVPQEPTDHDYFWEWWSEMVLHNTYLKDSNHRFLFASEKYGVPFAEALDAEYIPFDVKRELIPVKGTNVRNNIHKHFKEIIPSFQKYFKKTVTIFGAESVGKTTMAKSMADLFDGTFVPEWARQYLETVGPEVDLHKLKVIANGQLAIEKLAYDLPDIPLTVQDTDLLSTIGYYRLMGFEVPKKLVHDFQYTKSDLYLLLSSDIPFEPDALRYGGDKRESDDAYWINLLKEFDCKYVYVNTKLSRILRSAICEDEISRLLNDTYNPIMKFERT